ncbi:hypothetical protein [Herbidospora sp. RD11066]
MLIPCLACGSRFRPDDYFRACHDYNRGRDLVSWTCPACGNRDDLRVLPGELGFGYPARGRYAVNRTIAVPGMRRQRHDLRLEISLNQRTWLVSRAGSPTPPRPAP